MRILTKGVIMDISAMIFPLKPAGICTALLCGIIIGLERQLSGKPTGIRTSSLICLGAYVFVSVAKIIDPGESARIVAQIITGIGFLGAGVILTREGIVSGVTSAAVIWVLAGIGILVGTERYSSAVLISWIVVGILVGVNGLEAMFISLQKGIYNKFRKNKNLSGEDAE